jgi:hypothetical protein
MFDVRGRAPSLPSKPWNFGLIELKTKPGVRGDRRSCNTSMGSAGTHSNGDISSNRTGDSTDSVRARNN